MISPNSLIVARRHRTGTALASMLPTGGLLTLDRSTLLWRRPHRVGRPVTLVLPRSLGTRPVVHVVVCHRAPLAAVLGYAVVVGLRIRGDDVPGVQQARDEAEAAEGDVDERVGAAEAAFDPDCGWCQWWFYRGRWRVCLPAMGGKRMAIRPRKMSELHILLGFRVSLR